MSIVIGISVAIFLLLPYYLSIFLLEQKIIKRHMLQWMIFHSVFAVADSLVCGEWFNMVTVIWISCGLYYFFSYIFYGKNMRQQVRAESMSIIVNHKNFSPISNCVLGVVLLLAVADAVIIFTSFAEISTMLERIYLTTTIFLSFFQCVYYYRKMKAVYHVDNEVKYYG